MRDLDCFFERPCQMPTSLQVAVMESHFPRSDAATATPCTISGESFIRSFGGCEMKWLKRVASRHVGNHDPAPVAEPHFWHQIW